MNGITLEVDDKSIFMTLPLIDDTFKEGSKKAFESGKDITTWDDSNMEFSFNDAIEKGFIPKHQYIYIHGEFDINTKDKEIEDYMYGSIPSYNRVAKARPKINMKANKLMYRLSIQYYKMKDLGLKSARIRLLLWERG